MTAFSRGIQSALVLSLACRLAGASGAVSGGASSRSATIGARGGPVWIAWIDPAGAGEGLFPVARDEAQRVLSSCGVSLAWRKASPSELARDVELRVILLDRAGASARRVAVLGATPASADGPPFAWIHLPSIRAALGLAAHGNPLELGSFERYRLAVALGRVIAHELVHALAPDVPHGAGLMSRRLRLRDLIGSRPAPGREVAQAVSAAAAEGRRSQQRRDDTALLAAEHVYENLE